MSKAREISMERLDECWLTLYDLGQLGPKRLPTRDKAVIDSARYIVNRFQVSAGRKKKATAATVAEEGAVSVIEITTETVTSQGEKA